MDDRLIYVFCVGFDRHLHDAAVGCQYEVVLYLYDITTHGDCVYSGEEADWRKNVYIKGRVTHRT